MDAFVTNVLYYSFCKTRFWVEEIYIYPWNFDGALV